MAHYKYIKVTHVGEDYSEVRHGDMSVIVSDHAGKIIQTLLNRINKPKKGKKK